MKDDSAILNIINQALEKVTSKAWTIDRDTDLIESEILDSLDSMVFIMELEKKTGGKFPDTDLEEENFFKVGKLIDFLTSSVEDRE